MFTADDTPDTEPLRPLHPPFVKLCGLRALEHVSLAATHATYVGIVLAPTSRRAVSLARAEALCAALRHHGRTYGRTAQPVLVLQDATPDAVQEAAARCGSSHVQLHGQLAVSDARALRDAGLFVIRALADDAWAQAAQWADAADALLLDGTQPGAGTATAAAALAALPQLPPELPVWLAGGLRAENVQARYAAAAAAGRRPPPVVVDAASGLERDGVWCPEHIEAFVGAVQRLQMPRLILEPGGAWVSELLMPAILRLRQAWHTASADPAYWAELRNLLARWAGRPTPLYRSPALSAEAGCAVYLKREDLLHGGAHKTNNTLGQALLAKRMGCTQLIAETGAGQHGVATAMAGALVGLPVRVYMGAKDVARQAPNVARMRVMGAEVVSVTQGAATLKDAINEAMRAWAHDPQGIFYVFGTAAGPAPYPEMVRDLQRVIGDEAKQQLLEEGHSRPAAVVACVGGGSNAAGAFAAFAADPAVRLIAVEAAGLGLDSGAHGATLTAGRSGVVHGMATLLLQDHDGQLQEAHSVSAGLDYPGVGPGHALMRGQGRLEVEAVDDAAALDAYQWLARSEGILPALESAHAVAAVRRMRGRFAPDAALLLCLSGRGDKDLAWVMQQTEAAPVMPAPAPAKRPQAPQPARSLPPLTSAVMGPQRPAVRLTAALRARTHAGQAAFLPFLTLGDPNPEVTLAAARGLAAAGADALELGLPFSDPPADGPVLQEAATRALQAGMNTGQALLLCAQIHAATGLPLSLLAYANPLLQFGPDAFCRQAADAGVCALLVADVPLEHRAIFAHAARAAGLALIALVSLQTSAERAHQLLHGAEGFVYVAGQMGTTGERGQTHADLGATLQRLRCQTTLPLLVGFGLSQPIDVTTVRQLGADGAIVGSALVRALHEALQTDPTEAVARLTTLATSLADAAHATTHMATTTHPGNKEQALC